MHISPGSLVICECARGYTYNIIPTTLRLSISFKSNLCSCGERVAGLAPLAPVRAPMNPTCDFALTRAAPPRAPCLAAQAPFENFQGFLALAVVLRTVLQSSGAPLQLAAPSPTAKPVTRQALRVPAVCQGRQRAHSASNTRLWQEHGPRCG